MYSVPEPTGLQRILNLRSLSRRSLRLGDLCVSVAQQTMCFQSLFSCVRGREKRRDRRGAETAEIFKIARQRQR